MKLHVDNEQVFGSSIDGAVDFTVKQSAKAFVILSKNIYKYPERAIIREYSCNATDAHKDAGTLDTPFEVHLPTSIEPYFHVRDFGTGIPSKKELETLMTVYFESTKDQTNDFIGSFGLGAKSGYSYTDTFNITNYYNGRAYGFTAFVMNGEPKIIQTFDEETDEHNGLKISIPVNTRDIETWLREARYVLRHFKDHRPTINAVEIEYFPEFKDYTVGQYGDMAGVYAIMGKIQYPIPREFYEGTWVETRLNYMQGVYINFELGDLDLMPSREEVHLSEETKNNIKARLQEIEDMMIDAEKKKIAEMKTPRQLSTYMYGLTDNQTKIIKGLGAIGKWENPYETYKEFMDGISGDPECISGSVYKLYEISPTRSKLRPNAANSINRLGRFIGINVESLTVVLDDGNKSKTRLETLRGLYHKLGYGHRIMVFNAKDLAQMQTFEYVCRWFDESEINIIRVSEADDIRALATKKEEPEKQQYTRSSYKLPNVYIHRKDENGWTTERHDYKAKEIRALKGLFYYRYGDEYYSKEKHTIHSVNDLHELLDQAGVTEYTVVRTTTEKYLNHDNLECAFDYARKKLADIAKKAKPNQLGYDDAQGVISMLYRDDLLEKYVPAFLDKMCGRWYDKEKTKVLKANRWMLEQDERRELDEKFKVAHTRIKEACKKFEENHPLLTYFAKNCAYRLQDDYAADFIKLMK